MARSSAQRPREGAGGLPLVLVVDDDPITSAMMAEVLRDLAKVVVLDDGGTAVERAAALGPDLVLLDVLMPDVDGYAVCRNLKQDPRTRDIPVIFVSTLADEGEEARGLLAGAVDYVGKPISPAILTARVRNHLEIKQQRDRLEREAERDPVTGLGNRVRVEAQLAVEWRRATRGRTALSLAVIAIDHFAAFTRLCGPLGTRDCWRRVAAAVRASLFRSGDVAAVVAENGLCVLLPDTDAAGVRTVAERISQSVADLDIPNPAVGPIGTVSVSVRAMTWRPAPAQDAPEAIDAALDELARAQRQGTRQIAATEDASPAGSAIARANGGGSSVEAPHAARERAGGAGRVLIIDDDPVSVQVLGEVLRAAGYEIETVDRAADAIARIQALRPDLVLLDILMPEIDGFELCRRLKSNPAIAGIPVVFISVVGEPAEKQRAFDLGGADYVGKTFHPEEVLTRVSHQIKIGRLQREMADANQRLVELDRVKATFAAMLVHDLRSPLGVVQITLMLLSEKIAAQVDAELQELIGLSLEGLNNTIAMITELLEIYRSEHGEVPSTRERLDLGESLRRCVSAAAMEARRRGVFIETRIEKTLPVVGDRTRLERAFANLIGNALKFSHDGGRVAIEARPVAHDEDGRPLVRVEVRDGGRGIPESEIPYIFDLYRQAETGRRSGTGVGLGLAIVKRVLDAHAGRISVSSQVGIGTAFTIDLPIAN